MPLRATRPDSTSALAMDYGPGEWAALKAELRQSGYPWALGCCGAPAVPKSSQRGTAFFAHKAGAQACSSAGETEHHRYLKACAVAAARAVGWEARTEVPGVAPDGSPWIADVLAQRGSVRVAVEIQWSQISEDELQARQDRYAASGVRTLWLVRGRRVPSSRDFPAIGVRQLADGAYSARLSHHDSERWSPDDPHSPVRERPVNDVLEAAFSGRLRWGFHAGEPVHYTVIGAEQDCWNCKARTTLAVSVHIDASGTHVALDLDALGAAGDLVEDLLPADVRRAQGLGVIKRRYSRTAGEAYLSNGCVRCDALQGRMFEYRSLGTERPLHASMSALDSRWLAALDEHDLPHWRILETPRGVHPPDSGS
jgi:hypothetical protein